MRKINYLFILILVGFISGCSLSDEPIYTKTEHVKESFHYKKVDSIYIDYKSVATEAARNILSKIELPKKIIVTDFVDISSLDNHTKLGYVLSNNMKDALINNYNSEVVEVEVSKYFKISGNGVKILSRDVDKLLSKNFDVRYAVVGTYTHTDKEVIVFIKLIDLKTGIIQGSYANTFPMGKGTKMMLSTK
jgi:TolB-like protein